MIKNFVQKALDAALAPDGVHSYWQRKGAASAKNPDEYIIYTVDSDRASTRADGGTFIKTANIFIRYYHSFKLNSSARGRKTVEAREKQILETLESAGLAVSLGPFDLGDIDAVEFNTTGYECDCARLTDGQVENVLGAQG